MTGLRTVRVAAAPILVVAGPLAAAPVPVSPAGLSAQACPTFSWSLADGAEGYELAVYEVDGRGEAGAEPVLLTALPAGAQSWTPSAERCLERGGAYAWSVRVLADDDGAGEWSEAELFEVATAPSPDEVAAAVETLRRYLAQAGSGSGGPTLEAGPAAEAPVRRGRVEDVARPPLGRTAPSVPRPEPQASVETKDAPTASSTPSLTLSDQLHLAPDSHVFKDGSVFLWEDSVGNLALGESALASATGLATHNTAVGEEALHHATEGSAGTHGSSNSATGFRALFSNTQGFQNTALGFEALFFTSSGSNNTAVGFHALRDNLTGRRNTAIGASAASRVQGSDNVFVGADLSGSKSDSNTIRIGGSTGTLAGQQNRTFIAGIRDISLGLKDTEAVQIDADGRLGTISCGGYIEAAFCPAGTDNPDGPLCSRVPPGSFCETDGECGLDAGLNNCGGADWYLRVD